MKIDAINFHPYKIFFKNEYANSKISIKERKGWIISISNGDMVGYGDASPLDEFSNESYEQAGYGIQGFKLAMDGIDDIDFEEALQLASAHGEMQPSVQFAIETALYDLQSKIDNISLYRFLNSKSLDTVKVCSYDEYLPAYDNMVIKIKITEINLLNQVEMIDRLIDKYDNKIRIRIDFNESLDLPRAIRFCKMIEGRPIDYIEQPLHREDFEDMYELSLHTEIPLAADEMISDVDSLDKALEAQCASVFILKPMLIGGISSLKEMIKLINSESKRCNISSLLESNIGRLAYLNLCSAFNLKEESGIATNVFFKNDICGFPKVKNGIITLKNKLGIGVNEINI